MWLFCGLVNNLVIFERERPTNIHNHTTKNYKLLTMKERKINKKFLSFTAKFPSNKNLHWHGWIELFPITNTLFQIDPKSAKPSSRYSLKIIIWNTQSKKSFFQKKKKRAKTIDQVQAFLKELTKGRHVCT